MNVPDMTQNSLMVRLLSYSFGEYRIQLIVITRRSTLGMLVPVRVPYMNQIELFKILTVHEQMPDVKLNY